MVKSQAIARHDALSDEALDWIIRLNDGRPAPGERKAWALWRGQSEGHEAAAAEAETIWAGLGGAVDRWQGRKRLSRRALLAGGGVALISGLAWQAGFLGRHMLADYQTATAERRGIRLRDGTDVLMNAQSALSDLEAPGRRGADLMRGQAMFTVTASGAEPFRLEARPVQASLREGVLDLDMRRDSLSVTLASGSAGLILAGRALELGPGQRLRIAADGTPGPVETVSPEEVLAWQRGKLILERRPLADLASEIERYRGGRVVITSEALAARQLTGIFELSDTDAILDVLPTILPVRVSRLPLLTVIRET